MAHIIRLGLPRSAEPTTSCIVRSGTPGHTRRRFAKLEDDGHRVHRTDTHATRTLLARLAATTGAPVRCRCGHGCGIDSPMAHRRLATMARRDRPVGGSKRVSRGASGGTVAARAGRHRHRRHRAASKVANTVRQCGTGAGQANMRHVPPQRPAVRRGRWRRPRCARTFFESMTIRPTCQALTMYWDGRNACARSAQCRPSRAPRVAALGVRRGHARGCRIDV